MTEQNYYTVKFYEMPYEVYAYGKNALDAIVNAKAELMTDAMDTTPLGGALVRPAVYKEWIYSANAYTNGGQFLGRDI